MAFSDQQGGAGPAPRSRGFTLIELMIVVAVIAILSAIAYPSYREHVLRGNRNDAKGVLLENAQWMERNYTTTNLYNQDGSGTAISASTALPWPKSPRDGGNTYYTMAITAVASSSYTLTATPAGTSVNDRCGNLTITNTGLKGANGSTSGATVDDCWAR